MRKYFAFFALSFRHAMKDRKAFIGLSLFLITCLVIFSQLWKVAAAKTGAVSYRSEELLWYIAFNEWVLIAIPDTQEEMEQDLRTGRLAYLLPRPISYLGGTFAEALGTLTANLLVLGFVAFAFTWWQVGGLPFHPVGILVAVLFALAAGVVATLFHMMIGLTAFWLHEVGPFFWIWEKLLFMLGGLMLPLSVYPSWMQAVARWTPFPAILGDRSALALDFRVEKIALLAATLSLWGIAAAGGLILLYRRGLRILNVEGG